MDPLSITVSCVSLTTAIVKTSISVTKFVREVRGARGDLDAVSRELLSLKTVLELLVEDVADGTFPDQLRKQITGIVTICTDVVVEIEQVLQKHEGGKVTKAARWAMVGNEDMNKLRSSLEAHKSALEIALDMVALTITRDIKADTSEILQDTTAIKEQMKADTAQIIAEILRLQQQLPKDAALDNTNGIMLDRYLDNLTSYAETVCDTYSDGIVTPVAEKAEDVPWGSNRSSVDVGSRSEDNSRTAVESTRGTIDKVQVPSDSSERRWGEDQSRGEAKIKGKGKIKRREEIKSEDGYVAWGLNKGSGDVGDRGEDELKMAVSKTAVTSPKGAIGEPQNQTDTRERTRRKEKGRRKKEDVEWGSDRSSLDVGWRSEEDAKPDLGSVKGMIDEKQKPPNSHEKTRRKGKTPDSEFRRLPERSRKDLMTESTPRSSSNSEEKTASDSRIDKEQFFPLPLGLEPISRPHRKKPLANRQDKKHIEASSIPSYEEFVRMGAEYESMQNQRLSASRSSKPLKHGLSQTLNESVNDGASPGILVTYQDIPDKFLDRIPPDLITRRSEIEFACVKSSYLTCSPTILERGEMGSLLHQNRCHPPRKPNVLFSIVVRPTMSDSIESYIVTIRSLKESLDVLQKRNPEDFDWKRICVGIITNPIPLIPKVALRDGLGFSLDLSDQKFERIHDTEKIRIHEASLHLPFGKSEQPMQLILLERSPNRYIWARALGAQLNATLRIRLDLGTKVRSSTVLDLWAAAKRSPRFYDGGSQQVEYKESTRNVLAQAARNIFS